MPRFKVIVQGDSATARYPYATFVAARRRFEALTGQKTKDLQRILSSRRHFTAILPTSVVTIIDCEAEPTPAVLEALGQQRLF